MTARIYDFSDRVAIVTWGASGIRAATARRFAQSGASVVVADIDESRPTTRAAMVRLGR